MASTRHEVTVVVEPDVTALVQVLEAISRHTAALASELIGLAQELGVGLVNVAGEQDTQRKEKM